MQVDLLQDLSRGGAVTLQVNGGCMAGTLADGTAVRVEPRAFYRPGDVVVYARSDGTLVSHRLLGYLPGRSGWRVLTRADKTARADHPAALAQVLGRVTQVDGAVLKVPLRRRVGAVLMYFPALAWWLGQRVFGGV